MSVKYITGIDRRLPSRIGSFDLVRVIGERMVQIENGSPIYVPFKYVIEEIAVDEINTKNCPLSILRLRSEKDGIKTVEVWDVNEITYDKKILLS